MGKGTLFCLAKIDKLGRTWLLPSAGKPAVVPSWKKGRHSSKIWTKSNKNIQIHKYGQTKGWLRSNLASVLGYLCSFMRFWIRFARTHNGFFAGLAWDAKPLGQTRQPDFPEYLLLLQIAYLIDFNTYEWKETSLGCDFLVIFFFMEASNFTLKYSGHWLYNHKSPTCATGM